MPRLHCNVVAGLRHLNTSKVTERVRHDKEEKKTANARAKVDKALVRMKRAR